MNYTRADKLKDAIVGLVIYGSLGVLLFVLIPLAHWWACHIR